MTMTVWHLRLFVAVSDTGSMSAAAALFQIRQPSVSQKIAELEAFYSVLLFERLGNRLQITESGRQLLPLARDVVERFDFLNDFMQTERSQKRLRLGGTVTVGSTVFPRLLACYRDENPDTELFASVSNTEEICRKLMENQLDAALVEGQVRDPELICLPRIDDFLVLACGRQHPFYTADTLTIHQLSGMDFVMREPGSGTRRLFEEYAARHQLDIRIMLEYTSPDAIRSAVCSNGCLAVMSARLFLQDAAQGRMRLFRSAGNQWDRSFSLVYHKNKHIGLPLRRLFELLSREPFPLDADVQGLLGQLTE